MFSFFKRNKSKPSPTIINNNNNINNDINKTSVNMLNAIERQQASLQQSLEQRRKNDVNDREHQIASSHTANDENDGDDRGGIFRSSMLPSLVSECDKSDVLASDAGALRKQNYDQYRDARRSSSSLFDSTEFAGRQGKAPPIDNYQPSASFSAPTVAVASSISDQKCSPPIAGTDSTNAYNSVFEVMARGRNRNKHRGVPSVPQNQHKTPAKDDEKVSKNVNDSHNAVPSENSIASVTNVDVGQRRAPNPNNSSASAGENSEKSASISSENVLHDENSCSINSQQENKNDNMTDTSDEGRGVAAAARASSSGGATKVKNESSVESSAASGVKNDEHAAQQVAGAPLQRNSSAKRVTFAPSPPRSVSSSLSDDDEDDDEEEATTSEDIFYEAAEAPNDTQKLRILSTVTSHSSDCTRIDEETSEIDESISSGESSSTNVSKSSSNDVVCAKIILSVNDDAEKGKFSDNDDEQRTDTIKTNAFSKSGGCDATSISNVPRTIKPSYLDSGALPDIVAETSLLDQHQHLPLDEKATLVSQASNYNGNSIASSQIEVVDQMQVKVNALCMKIDELERELDQKTGAVERLQSELEANNKEGECVRQRLRYQDAQLERVKENQDLFADEEQEKYESLEEQYKETVAKLQKMQSLASSLNLELSKASVDVEKLRQERDEILDKLTVQEKLLRDILQTAADEREQIIAKWKHDFEQLRNVNCDREEHLMEDCEWKLRQMMKQCKEKLEKTEKEKLSLKDQAQIDRQTIRSQRDEIKNLKACEKEANHLRSLTSDQSDSLSSMMKRLDDLKSELSHTKGRLQDEIDSCQQIKRDCSYQLSEKERSAINRVEIARGEIAMEWEERLMEEMCRLTNELEQVHLDERNSALNKQKAEHLIEIQALMVKFKQQEQKLLDEIATLKTELNLKQEDLRETQTKADMQLLENRAYLDRQERDHQKELNRLQADSDRQERLHSDLIEEIKDEHKREKEQIKASFYNSLEQIKEEFANEITLTQEMLQGKHKREMEEQWKQLVHEKEKALLAAENRNRIRLEDADNKLSALKLKHQRQMNDLKDQFDIQKICNQNRDVSNTQEIDTLHRKCICLTKLFEEMRMRYERRDPRPEDLRRIDELKSVVDSQEKDIFYLTEQLRELQLQQQQQSQTHPHLIQNQSNLQNGNQSKKKKSQNSKTSSNNKSNITNNGNSNNDTEEQMRHQASEPQQIKQNANHEREQQQRMKPPPLIKTIIYEEENENELYEQQLRDEREHARLTQDQVFESQLQHQQNGVMVELEPESPDYSTKNGSLEEISEAYIVTGSNIPDVVVLTNSSSDDKLQEMRIEVITTIEPSNIQVVHGNSALDLELD